jgi:3-oxoacyl-[acyl-carrier protein] reductase
MDLRLGERVFLVTAASGGLGRATATALVEEGARVVLVARRAEVLAQATDELYAAAADGSVRAVALTADLAAETTAPDACALALETFGRLDGALVSAGGPPAGTVRDLTSAQWRDAFESVFLPALRVTEAVVAHGTAEDLAVGWVLSTSVKSPIAGLAASNGLRPGLGMLVKQLADELGPAGTRVFGLMPGRVMTERVQHLDALGGDPVAAAARAEAAIPLRRSGEPAEFGRVAAFLLSPAASYLTGCVIPVEGGALRSL